MNSKEELLDLFKPFVDDIDILSSNINNKISNLIIKYRLDNNLSKKDMAKLLDISYYKYMKIENEYYDFKISEIVSICGKLGYKIVF